MKSILRNTTHLQSYNLIQTDSIKLYRFYWILSE